ncbi:MAG: glycosyl transferase family protein [Acidobacteria bacterium]|nr:glycosyl transferase family protein [Acidobacteriota bacterium]
MPQPLLLFLAWLPDAWNSPVPSALARWAPLLLFLLASCLLLGGLDDLAVDLGWFWRVARKRREVLPDPDRERSIAIWIPLWHEAAVIRRMLEHNLAAIGYRDYEVFVGVYRNDPETRAEVLAVASRDNRVHLAEVPHDGPTMKADCLNWVYQRMLHWERASGRRMEVVVIHDAEDVIHPLSLKLVNRYCEVADMVQMPVLPLQTPWREWTHGLYCDDFAESQGKDLETRVAYGGFLPGCGVGTALRREAVDALALKESGCILQPASLTEDYDLGVRLHRLGFRQKFIPLQLDRGVPVATGEFFPRTPSAAIRQRTRWVTGNSLQAWQRHGWGRGMRQPWVQAWYFWRDRKGLWGNPLSVACNLLLIGGVMSWAGGISWWPAEWHAAQYPIIKVLLGCNMALFVERIAVRILVVSQFYGWRFASGVPCRLLLGNWINSVAVIRAAWAWMLASIGWRPLHWMKTSHAYPSADALRRHLRPLGEILVSLGALTPELAAAADDDRPEHLSFEDYLLDRGWVTERQLWAALSCQHGIPEARFDPLKVEPRLARLFPDTLQRRWSILPFLVSEGAAHVATTNLPGEAMQAELGRHTGLNLRFYLMPPADFDSAASRLWSKRFKLS